MLDQSFNADNFRRIFDLQNRKGLNLESRFFPRVYSCTRSIKNCRQSLRLIKTKSKAGTLTPSQVEKFKSIVYARRGTLKEEKKQLLTGELESIAKAVANGTFRFAIERTVLPHGKPGYIAKVDDAGSYFCMQQLQENLRKMFKVRQGNRNWIVSQLRAVLADDIPKVVVRTDLKEFYESASRVSVIQEVAENRLLGQTSKELLRILFDACPGSGLPRGLGVSSVLGEVILRRFDQQVRALPGVVFYGRYVDDIVVVFSQVEGESPSALLKNVIELIHKAGFSENSGKTKDIDLSTSAAFSFDYLGYKFSAPAGGKLKLGLSDQRLAKYKKRLAMSFGAYVAEARLNEKEARRALVKRVRFLTGNTRLSNNKKNVYVGPYFSNIHLTDSSDMRHLDARLRRLVAIRRLPALAASLRRFSFVKGFEERDFYSFSPRDLKQIGSLWKYA
jgi:hypothetical protein